MRLFLKESHGAGDSGCARWRRESSHTRAFRCLFAGVPSRARGALVTGPTMSALSRARSLPVCQTRLASTRSSAHFAPLRRPPRSDSGETPRSYTAAFDPPARQPLARGARGRRRAGRRATEARNAANAQHPARLAAHAQRTSCARRKSRRPPKHLLLSAPAALLSGFAGVAARRSARRLAEAAAEVGGRPRIRARADPAGGFVLAAGGPSAIFKDFLRPSLSSFLFLPDGSAALVVAPLEARGAARGERTLDRCRRSEVPRCRPRASAQQRGW